jgi:hypothetical protein
LKTQIREGSRRRSPVWRGVAVLTVALLAMGALAVTPATAGKFLTKKRGDKRFLGNTTEVTTTQSVAPQTGAVVTALCPAGQQATGGGASTPYQYPGSPSSEAIVTTESKPVVSGSQSVGWTSEVINASDTTTIQVTAEAVCAP